MSIYDDMQAALASEMSATFGQGVIKYTHPGTPTGPEYAPVPGVPTVHDCSGAVSGVASKYLQDGYITATDLQATLAVFDRAPTNEGTLQVNGREHQIIRVDQIPASGVVAAWRVFVKS